MKTGGLCNQADPQIISVYLLWPVLYVYMQWSDWYGGGGQPSWDDDVICSLALLLALMLYRLWKNSVLSCCAGSPCHWLLFWRTRERFSKLPFIHLKEILKAFYSANDRMMLYVPKRIENIVDVVEWWSFGCFLQSAGLASFQQERVKFSRKKNKVFIFASIRHWLDGHKHEVRGELKTRMCSCGPASAWHHSLASAVVSLETAAPPTLSIGPRCWLIGSVNLMWDGINSLKKSLRGKVGHDGDVGLFIFPGLTGRPLHAAGRS